jgi:hypothetical protein
LGDSSGTFFTSVSGFIEPLPRISGEEERQNFLGREPEADGSTKPAFSSLPTQKTLTGKKEWGKFNAS